MDSDPKPFGHSRSLFTGSALEASCHRPKPALRTIFEKHSFETSWKGFLRQQNTMPTFVFRDLALHVFQKAGR